MPDVLTVDANVIINALKVQSCAIINIYKWRNQQARIAMNSTHRNSNVFELRPFEYRSLWISDVHLGYKGCKASLLLDFLKSVNSEYLYSVGDTV